MVHGYRPRAAEATVLHAVVRDQLETFVAEAAARTEGAGLPRFVEREFRRFLTRGVLAHGFARLRCGDWSARRNDYPAKVDSAVTTLAP